MENYNETIQAEMTGTIQADRTTEWVGYGDVDGVTVVATYYTSEDEMNGQQDDIDFESALEIVQEIGEDDEVVRTLWTK